MEYVICWIIAGAVAGILARIAFPQQMPADTLGYLVVGVVGGVMGGWLFNAFLGHGHTGRMDHTLFASVGAVVLFGLHAVTRRRTTA